MEKSILTANDCREYIETRLFEPQHATNAELKKASLFGIELELFPFIQHGRDAGKLPVSLVGTEHSLTSLLAAVSKSYGGEARIWHPVQLSEKYFPQIERIEFKNGDRFLFEPGGQVEISVAPCCSLVELEQRLLSMREVLSDVTRQFNIHFTQTGTNPWFTVSEIGNQLQKPRYVAMEKYFDTVGPYGRQMMQQTGSLHINKNFSDQESVRVNQIVVANLLVPFVTALFANSSFLARSQTGHKAFRSFIWQNTDPARTGIWPGAKVYRSLDKEDLINAYLEFVLKAPLIYIPELGDRVFSPKYTFEFWLGHTIDGIRPNISHLENHISLLFPEVRLRGYLEMRSVDAPPPAWQMVPVYFYAGIFATDLQLEKALQLLLPFASRVTTLLKQATFGFRSDEIYQTSKSLVELAMNGIASLSPEMINTNQRQKLFDFYQRFVLTRTHFADEYFF